MSDPTFAIIPGWLSTTKRSLQQPSFEKPEFTHKEENIMGGGRWTTETYEEAEKARRAARKSAFDYSDRVADQPRERQKPHPSLDITLKPRRECLDSTDHKKARAIAVWFDHTGSMAQVPVVMQKRLPDLHRLLQRSSVEDPELLFACFGDATCDSVPLSVGEFESGNQMDNQLGNFVLQGGGGGSYEESADLAFFIMARLTRIDCWDKREEKGYFFFITDELARDVNAHLVRRYIGVSIQEDIPFDQIVKEAQERYHVYIVIPRDTNHGEDPELINFWSRLLGQNVLRVNDAEDIPRLIADTIEEQEHLLTSASDTSNGDTDTNNVDGSHNWPSRKL